MNQQKQKTNQEFRWFDRIPVPKTGKKYAKSTQTDNEKMKTEGFWIKNNTSRPRNST